MQLSNDHHRRLRSGLKVDVYVMNAVKEGVLRIENASYYVGKESMNFLYGMEKRN